MRGPPGKVPAASRSPPCCCAGCHAPASNASSPRPGPHVAAGHERERCVKRGGDRCFRCVESGGGGGGGDRGRKERRESEVKKKSERVRLKRKVRE